ncbi:PAQR family membrane homeostasis protein TrhA [Desulfoluna spongiiphila]|uniref:Hemolysin III n=1 Tax=Desulfoluna spongiiphila TaxID=419481 RepID=A0A1G5BI56_9BACT|nr:hemolysin III family protein [Desulfoluna spongiiphila]SCX89630.1 hemolysin III [Desulfoluna spongiiphila]
MNIKTPPPKKTDDPATQTRREEVANSLTHGIGAAVSVAGMVLLLIFASKHEDGWLMAGVGVFGTTLILLYLVSTAYHVIVHTQAKRVFQTLDHIAIYLLIAGTYTPITLGPMRGPWGWTLFGLIWALAFAGIVAKLLFADRFPKLSVLFYAAMGWVVVIAIKPVLASIPRDLFFWLFAGGIAYTAGLAFFFWERLPYNHAVWHVFVLAGSLSHLFGMLFYVTQSPL